MSRATLYRGDALTVLKTLPTESVQCVVTSPPYWGLRDYGDTVLDPFGGSGTVAQVATGNGRDSIYIDLNPKYVELARQRIGPLFCGVA